MIVTRSPLAGAVVLDLEPQHDARGFFARTWCAREAEAAGLNPRLAQASVSYNKRRGTLRGMHYQVAPHEEAKLVRCARGSIHDVVIDLRAGSATLGRHFAVTLSAENRRMLYVAEGFAHGFQTLEDDTEVCYQISEFYVPAAARGVRWDDPAFGIEWPLADPILNERDRCYPDFTGSGGGDR
jgi:dTDP-4-dehydrorhamnose 3,5-epimerase